MKKAASAVITMRARRHVAMRRIDPPSVTSGSRIGDDYFFSAGAAFSRMPFLVFSYSSLLIAPFL